ncbi:zinc ribbon domain-containing protein [Myxococcota bacterium]|nr:zinc ribbon domain-containing protein [Myxococcota bacterium]
MPTYEYLCGKCGHEFEREQRITEDPVKTCPKCRARKVQRLISRTGFVLKGGGWYSDLYSSSKPAPDRDSSKDSSSPSSAESKSDARSETKAAPKTDSKPKSDTKPAGKPSSKKPPSSAA